MNNEQLPKPERILTDNAFTPDFGEPAPDALDNQFVLSSGEAATLVDSVVFPADALERPGTLQAIREKYIHNNPLFGGALAMAIALNGLRPHTYEAEQIPNGHANIEDYIEGENGTLPEGTYDLAVSEDAITITLKPDALGIRASDAPFVEVVLPARNERIVTFDSATWAGVHGERPPELLTDEDFMKYRADLRVKLLLQDMYVDDLTPNDVIVSIHDTDPATPGFMGRASAEGPERINVPAAEGRGKKGMEFYVDAFTNGHQIDSDKIHLSSGGMSSEGAPTIESFKADLESRGIEVRNITKIIQDCNRGKETNPDVLAAFEQFAKGRGVAIDFTITTKEVHVFTPVLDTSEDITVQDYAVVRPEAAQTGTSNEGNRNSSMPNQAMAGNLAAVNTNLPNQNMPNTFIRSEALPGSTRTIGERIRRVFLDTLRRVGFGFGSAGPEKITQSKVDLDTAEANKTTPESVAPTETAKVTTGGGLRLREMRYIPGSDTLPNVRPEPGKPQSRDSKQQQKAVGLSNASKRGDAGSSAIKRREKADGNRRPPTKGAGSGRKD